MPPTKHYDDIEVKKIRKKAKEFLPKRLAYLAIENGFEYNKISLRNQKTRWGSCSRDKNISLNIALVTLPVHLIDYVLLHELTHTVHMNHSREFWDKLNEVCPNAKKYRKELKSQNPLLS